MRDDILWPVAIIVTVGAALYFADRFAAMRNANGSAPDIQPSAPLAVSASMLSAMDLMTPKYPVSSLETSPESRAMIQNFEGTRYTGYRDSGGNWTIGIGHLIQPGDGLSPEITLSEADVQALFNSDLIKAENAVRNSVTVPLTQSQFDALVDFVFNLGAVKFKSSTLLQKINAGDDAGAAAEFGRWVYSGNQILAALEDRRETEQSLWLA